MTPARLVGTLGLLAILCTACVGGDLGLEPPLTNLGDTGASDSDAGADDPSDTADADGTASDDVSDDISDGSVDVSDTLDGDATDTDAGPPTSELPAPEWNSCGGEGPLGGPSPQGQPGDSCGACDDGILVCDGRTALRCVGAREPNPCGGCQPLPYNPGESCGPCGDGTFTCQEDGAGACAGASRLNACGWCDALPGVPGQTCAQRTNSSDEGDSGSATWVCAPHAGDAPAEMLRCLPGGRNACGGTGVLSWLGEAASPGLPCGSCGGQLACESGERLACVLDASVNACGGCRPSDLEPGDACGSCGTVVCDEELQFPVCRERQHPCGACAADPEDEVDPEAEVLPLPGTACGADDGGADDADEDHAPVIARWACADTDERVLCLPLVTSVNACGGADDLTGQPGESCDDCPARWWSCDGPDNVLCLGAAGVPFATSCEPCGERLDPVTHPCAACGESVWTCDEELPVCDGDIAPSNECGGCRPLHAEPGDECGSGDIAAHWTCDPSDPERVVCSVSSSGTLDRCTDLQCGGQNRVCISGGDNQHDRCGGCLPAFEEVDGECISNECAGGIQDCPIFGQELGWFVAPASSGGNPNGSMAAPFNNVQDGINAASTSSTRRHVYIAMGTYEESLNLANRVSLFGGFDPETGWSRSATNLTRIASPSPVALRVSGYSGEGTVEFLEFVSSDATAPGVSSQSAILIDVEGALLFRANTFQAGRGADGQAGQDGTNGAIGLDGRNASGATPGSGGGSPCASGGSGGTQGGLNGRAGVRGDTASPGGASGGAGGTGGNSGLTICIAGGVNAGSAGRPGGDGTHGPSGQGFATQARGALNTQGRWSAGNGHNGSRGQHGGGGGGGGGASCSGGAGGGGGGAGCGGGGGQGGTGAGGSIAVTVARSPGAAFEGNTFRAADGGDGGRGGAGQPGGDGGRSGNGGGSRGEPGGRGGDGGNGGHGGGGAGGASIGVLVFQSTGFQLGPGQTFELGAGGQPGTATSPGAPGAQGLSQDVLVLQ